MHRIVPIVLLSVALPTVTAQDDAPFARQTERLRRACTKMAGLDAVAVTTRIEMFPAKNQPGGLPAGPKVADTHVVLAEGVLHVAIGDTDEIATAGRASIARQANGDWALRDDRLYGGAKRPFVFDEQVFFRALGRLEPVVSHADVGEIEGRPVEIYTVTLSRDDVGELLWAGLLPMDHDFGLAFATMLARGGGGAALRIPKPNVRTDLAIAVDPATEHVVDLRMQMLEPSIFGGAAGQIAVRVGQGGVLQVGGQEEAAEPEKPEELTYENGLPVREQADDIARRLVRVTFSDWGTAKLPSLGADGRALLGLPPAPKPEPTPDPPQSETPR